MNTNDIIVGKVYRNLYLDQNSPRYLGCGMRKLYTGSQFGNEEEFLEKHLVCIESGNPSHIGYLLQEGENAAEGLWDNIVAVDDPEWEGTFFAMARQDVQEPSSTSAAS